MSAMILTNLNTATAVAAGGTLPLGSAVHGYGKCVTLNGNSLQINGTGYYQIDVCTNIAVTGTEAVSIQLFKNGVAVPGAGASATPAAAGAVVNLSLPWVFRKGCCCESDVLSFEVTAAGTVNQTILRVVKL